MRYKSLKFFVLFTFLTFTTFSQKTLTFTPQITASTPDWAKLMYSENPNVWEIDIAYQDYYQSHEFIKTTHTQFYKKWRRKVEPFITEAGLVEMPSIAVLKKLEAQYLELLQKQAPQKNSLNTWNCLGPFETYSTGSSQVKVSWQANIYTIDIFSGNASILYVGTEAGGIFKTIDKGLNWTPASYSATFKTIRSIKIHPTDSDIVYAGDGSNLYKTSDGGANWTTLHTISGWGVNDISINPTNPNIMLIASNQGLHRSTDAGNNWTQLYTDYCYDIEIKPNDSNIIYLLKNNPTDIRCEFFKSTDQGATFTQRDDGWYGSSDPNRANHGGRMTVTPADNDKIYVVLIGNSKSGDNGFIGVYRSDNAGEFWTLPSGQVGGPYSASHPNLMTLNNTNTLYQGYYNLGIAASHLDADDVLIGGLNLWKTEDGATTYTALGGYQGSVGWIHPDQQEIEVSGGDFWIANDGGANYSTDLFSTHESRKNGIVGTDFWGFGHGWNEDLMVGGRYHNGNTAFKPSYPTGDYLRLGGGEAPTGYVNPGIKSKAYFSDISDKIIPNSISGDVINMPNLQMYPSETFYASHSSELEYHPSCYKTIYIGNDNNLWKSEDEGQSYTLLNAFGNSGNPVSHFEISRSNPDVIYVYQRTSFYGATLWKTSDGGINWVSKAFPNASSQRAGSMTLSATDENTLWVAFAHQNNDGQKIWKTTDGGDTWTNSSTATLDGHTIIQVFHQAGTNGMIYLGTNHSVFYKDESMSDWLLYNNGLPARIACNIIRPFYKENKMRMATYGNGIWEVDFQTNSAPLAQPMVDKLSSFCSRDTFYFDDYSILNHNGATWSWNFPGATWVSSTSARNPKVVYGTIGSYDVSLTVTDANGTSSKTIANMVTVGNECDPESIPGNALSLAGGASDFALANPLNISSNTFSITAWIKRDGDQTDWAGIVFNRGSSTVGLNIGTNNELRFHPSWGWNSGLVIPDNEWTHVAMVMSPTETVLYMNGIPATNTSNPAPQVFDSGLYIGADPHSSPRRFKGLIDEVCIWTKSLTQEEIREQMHLTKIPANDPDILHYYQFNRASGVATDRASVNHASLGGNASRTTSTMPAGGGTSSRMSVTSGGSYDFTGTDVNITFPASGTYPNGELVVSKINTPPDQNPGANPIPVNRYWVVNNFGSNATFSELESISFSSLGGLNSTTPNLYDLHKRSSTSDGNTWFDAIDFAEIATLNSLTFSTGNNITSFSQFAINSNIALPVDLPFFAAMPVNNENVKIIWTTAQENQNKYFEVQRSSDGIIFQTLQKIPSKDPFSSQTIHYETIDENPKRGLNYYRLKQVDINGNFSFSEIRTVLFQKLPNEFVVFPNPIANGQLLQINTSFSENYTFTLYNSEGKRVLRQAQIGDAAMLIDDLEVGFYFYRIETGGKRFNGKIGVWE